jgi:RNA polymerase sigma-70 factor (ECF subfamily)
VRGVDWGGVQALPVTSYARDAELVELFQRGDSSTAYAELMRSHLPWVLAMCQYRVGDDAEDVCQEVFLEAYRDLPALRNPQLFKAWLAAIARRQCQKAIARRHETIPLDFASPHYDPWSDVTNSLDAEAALMCLTPSQRQTVTVALLYGYRVQDTARILGIPVGTVKSRIHSARRRLKEFLQNREGESKMDSSAKRIVAEVEKRLEEFEAAMIRPVDRNPELLDPNVRWWHERRQADAENNARLYGIEVPDVGMRMTRERIMSGTLSRGWVTREHWAIPEGASCMDVRDLSRRLLVSPFTIWEWSRQGMPTIRYYPWRRYEWDMVSRWLADQEIEIAREASVTQLDNLTRYVLEEVRCGRGSVADAEEILESM